MKLGLLEMWPKLSRSDDWINEGMSQSISNVLFWFKLTKYFSDHRVTLGTLLVINSKQVNLDK